MGKHDLLKFLVFLKEYIANHPEAPSMEAACWPTYEMLAYNVRLNKTFFPHPTALNSVAQSMQGLGLISIGPCGDGCHGEHYSVTEKGLRTLAKWDREGCEIATYSHRTCRLRGAQPELSVDLDAA